MEIVGPKARIVRLPRDSGPVFETVGRATSSLDLPPAVDVLLPLVSDFVEAVLAERLPACREVLMDAVKLTAREGLEVAIDGGAES